MATKKKIPPKGNPHAPADRKGFFKPTKKGKPTNRYESIAESFESLARTTRGLQTMSLPKRVEATQKIIDGLSGIVETLSALE